MARGDTLLGDTLRSTLAEVRCRRTGFDAIFDLPLLDAHGNPKRLWSNQSAIPTRGGGANVSWRTSRGLPWVPCTRMGCLLGSLRFLSAALSLAGAPHLP